jgi:hypothetical protein
VTIVDGAASTEVDTSVEPVLAELRASPRDLVALILGRASTRPLVWSGDEDLGRAFSTLFPSA